MEIANSKKRAIDYCQKHGMEVDFDNLLGQGQEGFVWRTSEDSAIKVYDNARDGNFRIERGCYEILAENEISDVEGFAIPQFIRGDADLLIIEMSIVAPPFILDFGKAYLFARPRFSTEVMDYYMTEREELFEGNWGLVQSAIGWLEMFGIFYSDARPGNISCDGHPDAVAGE